MTTLLALDVGDLEQALRLYCDALADHREALNSLNVYPVPDGDTGTNMSLTLRSVISEVDAHADEDAPGRWKAISHGSLMGARGNSGVIMSQILRGLCDRLGEEPSVDASTLASGLTRAAEAAYQAVLRPAEGTILTVVRESAASAVAIAAGGGDLRGTVAAATEEAAASLARTPELLPVLKDAGVVDAGGAGYLLFLQSLRCVVDGTPVPASPRVIDVAWPRAAPSAAPDPGDLRYEVMFFLDAGDDRVDEFKASWASLGDSIVVVGGEGLWNCHIHSNDIGGCIEAGISVGRPHGIRVTDLFDEVDHVEEMAGADDGGLTITGAPPATTGVVAVAAGEGVRRIFESLGVHAVVRGGQSMNPSTGQLVEAVRSIAADQVVILPNNKNIIPVAQQVDSQVSKRVHVIPTRSIAEGFAALLAYDPATDAHANAAAMTAAAEAVVAGEVTQAVRESNTAAGVVTEGDWIGLDRTGVRSIESSMAAAATSLLELLLSEHHELVTVIVGAGASESAVSAVTEWLEAKRPEIEFEVHEGGQPLYPFYFGIE